jgi:hypothetical protein
MQIIHVSLNLGDVCLAKLPFVSQTFFQMFKSLRQFSFEDIMFVLKFVLEFVYQLVPLSLLLVNLSSKSPTFYKMLFCHKKSEP